MTQFRGSLKICVLLLTAGSDYTTLVNNLLTFTSTSLQRQCVNIGIIDDLEVEPTEQFFVRIEQTTSQGPRVIQAGVLIVNGRTSYSPLL